MKAWGIAAVAGACLLGASPAGATVWQPMNTCWTDFDVGGGKFCGLKSSQCGGVGASPLRCSTSITTAELPPIGSNLPSPTHVAVDDFGKIFLVGSDQRIYFEYLGLFVPLSAQPGLVCISKLLAINTTANLSSVVLLALGCDSSRTLRRYSAGSWTTIASNSTDVSVAKILGIDIVYLLAGGNGSIFYLNASATAWTEYRSKTDVTFPNAGVGNQTITLHTALIAGGNYSFLGGAFSVCNTSGGGIVPWLFESHTGAAYGPDPGGCPALQIPQGGGNKVLKMTSNRGPGNDIFWILTDFGRVYALTVDNSTT